MKHEVQVIVDETAPNSLALLQSLSKTGNTERVCEGIYIVTAEENKVFDVTDEYPEAVIKVESI